MWILRSEMNFLSLQPELLDAEVSAFKRLKTKAPKEVFDQKESAFKSGLILSLSKGEAACPSCFDKLNMRGRLETRFGRKPP